MDASGGQLSCPMGFGAIWNDNRDEMITFFKDLSCTGLSCKQILKIWLPVVANFLDLWVWDLFGMTIVMR